MMVAQSVPIGISLNSPVAWFVIAVACVVVVLTISTRRDKRRPRIAGAPGPSVKSRHAGEWAAAQARFFDDPRAGLRAAVALVTRVFAERRARGTECPHEASDYAQACAIAKDAHATTDEMRRALLALRRILDEVDELDARAPR